MKFETLLQIVDADPVFESSLLLTGDVEPALIQQQLSRWVRAGRLLQIRRGLYALAPPWRKTVVEPFALSNRMVRGSYVSCESALSRRGLIPEAVFEVTAVSPGRTEALDTPLGRFRFRHLAPHWIWGFTLEETAPGQKTLIATPEKALLDLIHLTPGGDSEASLSALRLQNLDRLSRARLRAAARRTGRPKLLRAAEQLVRQMAEEFEAFEEI